MRDLHHFLMSLLLLLPNRGVLTVCYHSLLPFSTQCLNDEALFFRRGELEMRCLRRSLLLKALAQELPPDTIRYSSHVVGIEEDGYFKLLHLDNGSRIKTKVLLGCDGVNSVVAQWLGLSKPVFTKRSATRGFAVFPEHGFKPEFSMISGGGIRFGLLPCDENNLYWFFIWTPTDQDKEAEHDAGKMRQTMLNKMHKLKFPEKVIEVVEKSEISEVVSHPLRYRWPFDLLTGNISKGNVCVAGDALHPMTPDIGQGGCSALEDAIVLVRSLGEALLPGRPYSTDEEQYAGIKKSLEKYAKERRWRSFGLIATACLVGYMQQSEGVVMNFLRDMCFSGILVRMLLNKAEFDCGEI